MTRVAKVLILVPDLTCAATMGGIQVFNNYLVSSLRTLGCEIRVVAVNDHPCETDPDVFGCGRVHWAKRPLSLWHAIRLIYRFKPNVIINGHSNFSSMCTLLNRLSGIDFVTVVHGIEVWSMRPSRAKWLAKSKKILSVSRFTRDRMLAQLPDYAREDVIRFPNTFDENRFRPGPKPAHLMERFGIQSQDKVALTVSRLAGADRAKGYDQVIHGLSSVIDAVPNTRYVLAGKGDDRARIQSLVRERGLGDHVRLVGFVPDEELTDLYNLCDVFVMPSKGEGFGIVYLEALACGKPVIAGNADGSTDPLLDGELGELVDPDSTEQIAAAMIRVLAGSASTRLYDGEYLRTRVVSEFGIARFEQRLSQVLEDLIADGA